MSNLIKRLSLFAIVFALSFVLFADSTSAANTKVLIDPGHGGSDPGAQGNGLKEKDLTLDISKRVNSYLNSNYVVDTKMTRTGNQTVSLDQRTSGANSWGADLFLSIHINAGGGTGYEDYIHSSFGTQSRSIKRYDTTSPKVQQAIRAEVKKVLAKYKVSDRGAKSANFHVLRESGMPAVLLEIMFIDTKKDAKLLKNANFKQDMAVGISKGVANAYQLKSKSKPTPKPDTNIKTSKDTNNYVVTASKLNIRSGNSTKYGVVGSIAKNKTIKATGKTSNNWIKFKHKGKDAFVSGSHLKVKPKASKPKPSKPSNGKTYRVKSGDTLYSIAVKHNVSVNNLKSWNKLKSNYLSVNQKLNVSKKSTPKPSKPKPSKPSKPSNAKTYTVKSGDTLYSIAVKHKVSVNNLKSWNKLKSNTISVNQKLNVSKKSTAKPSKPKPSKPSKAKTYTVKSGDTLYSISLKNKVSVNNLKSWNNLKSNTIRINQKLNVSNKSTSSKPSVGPNKKMTVTASLVNIRNKATINGSKVIARLAKGSTVTVTKKHNSHWYQINYNGTNAYVSSKHVK